MGTGEHASVSPAASGAVLIGCDTGGEKIVIPEDIAGNDCASCGPLNGLVAAMLDAWRMGSYWGVGRNSQQ
ncbi:hypothetical protein [Brenneria roseae]|uniref:hypothetical protein n=1 Tax=Brenneria roseae TaxID=1509241 RepID=UPI0011B203AB|nr:hypothetical protein [Brenneria roseae]